MRIAIFTDGACLGNPGPGGWAAILAEQSGRREITGYEADTTNNRMEMRAALEALRALGTGAAIDLYTDSQYLRNGMRDWMPKWKRNNWRTAAKQPVKNTDLWRELDAAASAHDVEWHWVRGHDGHPENERCDALANEAIRQQGPVA